MKIYRVKGSEELSKEFDLDKLKSIPGITIIVYDYHTEPYEGNGEMLLKKNSKWYRVNLGHCSCYGPLDNVDNYLGKQDGKSLKVLLKDVTPELREQLKPILLRLKKLNHSQKG